VGEAAQVADDRQEDVLRQVVGFGGSEAVGAEPTVEKRAVKSVEPRPRLLGAGLRLVQQSVTRRVHAAVHPGTTEDSG
jgi:hypothetical protein